MSFLGLLGRPDVSKLKAKRNVKGLINALNFRKDEDRPDKMDFVVRRDAAEALGQIGNGAAIGPLIGALDDRYGSVRAAAAEALGILGDPVAVEPLIRSLKSDSGDARKSAAKALARLGDSRAMEPISALLYDREDDARLAAAEAMSALGWRPKEDRVSAAYWIARRNWSECVQIGSAAVEPLIAALDDFQVRVRQNAASALGQIGDARAVEPLIAQAEHGKPAMENARQALVSIGPAAIGPLINSLQENKRCGATDILGEIGSAAVEPLITVLQHKSPRSRMVAMSALEKIGDRRAVGPIVALLKDDEVLIRRRAITALSKIKGTRAVDALCTELSNEEAEERRYIAQALGETGHARAVEPLTLALQDDDREIRIAAAQALGEIKKPQAVEPLIAALGDTDNDVVVASAAALARIYGSGELSAQEKQVILAQKGILRQRAHTDEGLDCHHRDYTHFQADFLL
jgi:HEAT repeat protein